LVEFVGGCCDARNDGGNANETGRDLRSRKKPFRNNDNRDDNHHERIHDSQRELNYHRRGAADTTRRTFFAAKAKICSCWGPELAHPSGERQRNKCVIFQRVN